VLARNMALRSRTGIYVKADDAAIRTLHISKRDSWLKVKYSN
jgi:hypothetical protein